MQLLKLFWFLFPSLALFAVEPAGGGSPAAGGDPPAAGTDPVDPVAANANGGGEGQVTMSQAEFDKTIGARAKQAAQAAVSKLLGDFGVEDAGQIKAALAKAKELEEASLTEAEKLKREVEAANAATAEAKANAVKALALADEMLLKAAVITQATAIGFNDAADAWLYIKRDGIKKGDEGYEGLEDAVKAVAEAKPYLLKSAQPATPNGTPPRQARQPVNPAPAPNGNEQPERLSINF